MTKKTRRAKKNISKHIKTSNKKIQKRVRGGRSKGEPTPENPHLVFKKINARISKSASSKIEVEEMGVEEIQRLNQEYDKFTLHKRTQLNADDERLIAALSKKYGTDWEKAHLDHKINRQCYNPHQLQEKYEIFKGADKKKEDKKKFSKQN